MSDPEKKPLLPIVLPPRYEWIRHLNNRHPVWTFLCVLVTSPFAYGVGLGIAYLLVHKLWA